jgi:hypothetical protein
LDCKGQGYRPIDQTRRSPAIKAIFEMARRTFLPKAYTCDLAIDYEALTGWNRQTQRFEEPYEGRFIWILRQNGTEFYRLDDQTPEDLGRSIGAYRYWTGLDNHGGGAAEHVYMWNGELLVEVTPQMGETLLRDARHSLDSLNYA